MCREGEFDKSKDIHLVRTMRGSIHHLLVNKSALLNAWGHKMSKP